MRLDSDAERVEQGSLLHKKAILDKTLGRDEGRGGEVVGEKNMENSNVETWLRVKRALQVKGFVEEG